MPDLHSFHELVKTGALESVQKVLQTDPSLLNARNDAGQNAVLLAHYYRQPAIADYLLTLQPELDVFTAAVAGLLADVLEEVDHDTQLLGARNTDGWTLLHLASFFGHAQLAEALLKRGALVDARSTNAMESTSLHAAVAGQKTDLARLLLAAKADVNARQTGGWTPLHGAAQSGNRDLVELLIANGADIGARAGNNQSALDLALLKGQQEVAALLEELGAQLQ